MKQFSLGILLAFGLAACGAPTEREQNSAGDAPGPANASPPPAAPALVTAGWTVTEGVDAPESAYLDSASGAIFVSIMGGQPLDRDGNGRIMRLAPDGKVVSAAWVTGLNAPKGLRSHGGTLWTADIDEIVGIDIPSARITSRVKIEGAQMLNDVACGEDGTVYVSDSSTSKIHALKNGTASIFAEGEHLEYPNGLLVEDDRLIVGGWGKAEADFTTKVPGRLYTLDLRTKAKTLITPKPFGNIDGVESDGRDGYILTDFMKGQLLHVTGAGESRVLRQFKPGTADLAFVASYGIAIIPYLTENKVAAYDVSDVLK